MCMASSQVADKSHVCTCSGGGADSDTSSGPDNAIYDRKKLLTLTSALIQETHDRISGDRFRVREGDKEKLQYLRALTGLIALHTSLLEKAGSPDYEGVQHPIVPMSERMRGIDDLLKGLDGW